MSLPRLRCLESAHQVHGAAAERVAAAARNAVERHGRFTWVLAGGSTPRGLYRLLAREPYRSTLPWAETHVLFGDERCVPPQHEDSNYRLARETLLDHLPIPSEQVLRMEGELPPPQAAERYEARLRAHFLGTEAPPFDLVLLGLGADGHTLSLFPGTPGLTETRRWVLAQEVPSRGWRLTLTPAALPAARAAIWLVTGGDKAGALRGLLEGPSPKGAPAESPARRVLGLLQDSEILADEAASGDL